MKLINNALQEKNLKISDLSESLQERIHELQQLILKYNQACAEYEEEDEEDEEIEKELDEQSEYISQNEAELAEEIMEDDDDNEAPQRQPPQFAKQPQKPQKKSSAGWLIFGGVVALVTLGAVNVFKKK